MDYSYLVHEIHGCENDIQVVLQSCFVERAIVEYISHFRQAPS